MADDIPWTRFSDMHSGGRAKERDEQGQEISQIYIQAPEREAEIVFYNRFGHAADRISCTCCGSDYSVTQLEDGETPTQEREYWLREGYRSETDRYVDIPADEIKPDERVGAVPTSGWVWQD